MDAFATKVDSSDLSDASQNHWLTLVKQNATLCMSAIVLAGVAGSVRVYLLETAAEKIQQRLRALLFGRLLKRSQGFFDSNRTGELVNRLGTDITVVSRSVNDAFWGLRTGVNAILGSAMVVKTAPLSIVPQLVAPVLAVFVGGLAYGKFLKKLTRQKHDALAEASALAEERLAYSKIVKLNNGELADHARYVRVLDKVYELANKAAFATGGQVLFFTVFGGGFIVDVIYSCGMMISDGTLTLGQTSALAGYLLVAGKGYQGVMTAYGDIQKALGASTRLLDLIGDEDAQGKDSMADLPTSSSFLQSSRPLLFNSGPTVEFKSVNFSYPLAPQIPILSGVSLTVPAGTRQAIVGPSGCGKSSILSLISRLYEPNSGSILINGKPIQSFAPEDLRSATAVVPQESALFAGTIEENICYPRFDRLAEEQKMDLVDRAALGFVRDWTTSAGERGHALSGGERQRLCIARALMRDSPLVLLDEATSALDRETDEKVLKSLAGLQNKTVIAVTHKLTTVNWSERLTVVDEGRIVQEGATADLLRNPGPTLMRLLTEINSKGRGTEES